MFFFVFPKPFEKDFFLRHIASRKDMDDKTITRDVIYYRYNDGGKKYGFIYTVIDDSDIMFTVKFNSILMRLIREGFLNLNCDGLYPVLFGSCGTSSGMELGNIICVNEAQKFDRGYIVDHVFDIAKQRQRFTFVPEEKDIESSRMLAAIYGRWNVVPHKLYCSNFIYNCEVPFKDNNDKEFYNMETFEFYSICKAYNFKYYGCFRFISDYINPEKYTPELRKHYKIDSTDIEVIKKDIRSSSSLTASNFADFITYMNNYYVGLKLETKDRLSEIVNNDYQRLKTSYIEIQDMIVYSKPPANKKPKTDKD